MIPFEFKEMMEGRAQLAGENFDRPFRFLFDITAPSVAGLLTSVVGEAKGTVNIDGFARDAPAIGMLEMSPVGHRTIRYVFDFPGSDGKGYKFDGRKSINWLKSASTWTTLPGSIYGEDGSEAGTAILRFSWKNHLPGLLRSIRLGKISGE